MHLMAQPVIAERALGDDLLSGQGFLPRCLLAWPESTAGHRPYREEDLRSDPAIGRLAHRLGELHRMPLPLAPDDRQELAPPVLQLSDDAKAAWIGLHDAVEAGMASGEQFANVKGWASKTPEQALRIAGAVSYTHLDVYQRQSPTCVPGLPRLLSTALDRGRPRPAVSSIFTLRSPA